MIKHRKVQTTMKCVCGTEVVNGMSLSGALDLDGSVHECSGTSPVCDPPEPMVAPTWVLEADRTPEWVKTHLTPPTPKYTAHEPTRWTVVSQNAGNVIVLLSMCKCGDDDCAFTVTAHKSDIMWQHRNASKV